MFVRSMPCASCRGVEPEKFNCTVCGGLGLLAIASCPKQMPGREHWDACELSDYAEKNSWPVSGGVLDQSDSFLTVHTLVQSTQYRLLNPSKK